jgi:predicted transcriptional regulator
MKTASFPSLRVDPRLRDAAQSVLQEGETLSAFIETSVRESIERRRARAEFIARGLASREQAQSSGVYIAADEVRSELDKMLSQRQADLRVKAQR